MGCSSSAPPKAHDVNSWVKITAGASKDKVGTISTVEASLEKKIPHKYRVFLHKSETNASVTHDQLKGWFKPCDPIEVKVKFDLDITTGFGEAIAKVIKKGEIPPKQKEMGVKIPNGHSIKHKCTDEGWLSNTYTITVPLQVDTDKFALKKMGEFAGVRVLREGGTARDRFQLMKNTCDLASNFAKDFANRVIEQKSGGLGSMAVEVKTIHPLTEL